MNYDTASKLQSTDGPPGNAVIPDNMGQFAKSFLYCLAKLGKKGQDDKKKDMCFKC